MSSSHSNTATATTPVQPPPVYSTLSPPSYTAPSDTNSVVSHTSVSKKFLGRMWNSRDEERSDKKGKGKKQERQREVEEKEIRAAARAAYFAAQ
ncbi:hypothetical protein COCC4DRAFT_50032 [Bipolaris maydis ATCC 48331]|uniref:Uncharacterized protein n=1 Tax=Cochliobolus heterostrophus (strain C4 / ATCC 48331 / race T) TaxID=665024 RepID=N4XHI6_COCH4|nr:uncharacterized protein COCC4DRAFT_50032 [Bipolaris maydis ATCC 48331]ENI06006.1 hypothetical protein COCC4DRAFT_50032 [Bipolaris maydis ATCC 48331]